MPTSNTIIVDGGSTDNTLELVERFGIPNKQVISEPDEGIYDAMNKGIRKANGTLIGILNSDDYYTHDRVLERMINRIQEADADSVYADLQYVSSKDENQVVRNWRSGDFHPRKFLYGWMPPHPTFFVKKKIYNKLGLFDAGFDISGDYELMLRFLYRHRISTAYLPETVVHMRTGGNSNNGLITRIKANREDRLAWEMNELEYPFYTPILKPVRKLSQYRLKIASLFLG